jgi:hypothetical protein
LGHRKNLALITSVKESILDSDWNLSAQDWMAMSRCNRAAGLEVQAQQCERLRQAQTDQAMADHIAHSRAVYQQEMERTSAWQEKGVLERMGHEPMSPQQIAANRRNGAGQVGRCDRKAR